MSEEHYNPTLAGGGPAVGVELELEDVAAIGKVAGTADDRLLADLVRVPPLDSIFNIVSKAIIPYRYNGVQTPDGVTPLRTSSTVAPSQAADGSIAVNPFRAIVGSRTLTPGIDNWRDIRSAVYVGGAGSGALGASFQLGANSSGNPRWDLVCAQVIVDGQGGADTRRVKDPNSSTLSVQNVFETTVTTVGIAIVAGTPGATPSIPATPVDVSGSGTYYIPLAAVRVINGFGSTSTLLEGDIRDYCSTGFAGVARAATLGTVSCQPASGNNDRDATYGTNFPWVAATAHQRPSVWLPPQMSGGDEVFIEIDYTTPGAFSHPNATVVDSTRDWRNRFFRSYIAISNNSTFGNDQSAVAGTVFPMPVNNGGSNDLSWQMAQTFVADGTGHGSLVTWCDHAVSTQITNSTNCVIYCDAFTGKLMAYNTGNPGARLFVWIVATAPYPGTQ